MQLTVIEARVLGALIEKEITTPEYYPLSLNALLAACNQKTSREPVMTLSEDEARAALRSLEDHDLISMDHSSRVQRYEHRARTVFHLWRDETAIFCLLLLRGSQTPGELRGRADRLHAFDGIEAVEAALARMLSATEQRREPLVVQLPRQPGMKEQRYAHALGDPGLRTVPAQPPFTVATANQPEWIGRITRLEAEIAELREAVDRLGRRLDGNAAP